MANMMNLHTIAVCGVDLISAAVVLLHGQLVELVGEVVSGARVHVPPGINRIRGGMSVAMAILAMGVCGGSSSDLTIHVTAVIVDAEILLLEPFEAARGDVPDLATYLADRAVAGTTTSRAAGVAHVAITTARHRRA